MADRRTVVLFLLFLVVLFVVILRSCGAGCGYAFPDYNAAYPPPSGTPAADIFALSQDYPKSYPDETVAWTDVDFRTSPTAYAQAVLGYCLDGNTGIDFKVQNNSVRKWYHAPWLHYGENGREWRHGLTRERNSRPRDLHPNQTAQTFSWAVGFYNAPGGFTIRNVWPDCGKNIPSPSACTFPEKTVAFKLLFTTASNAQVPFLVNSFAWTANIGPPQVPRTDQTVRLLQLDIAVKDARSPIGWVFGTFVYDGSLGGSTPWERLQLVGVSWGNDPTVTSQMNQDGAFVNSALSESFVNASLIPSASTPANAARVEHFGLGGRMNGPIDNRISSCTSCHGKAAVLRDPAPTPIDWLGRMPRVVPGSTPDPAAYTVPKFGDFFGTNTPAGSGLIDYNCFVSNLQTCSGPTPTATFIKTDYSLQIAVGIENYYAATRDAADAFINAQGGP